MSLVCVSVSRWTDPGTAGRRRPWGCPGSWGWRGCSRRTPGPGCPWPPPPAHPPHRPPWSPHTNVCSLLRAHDLHNTLGDVSMIASLDTGAGVAGLGLPCPPGHMCAHIKVSSYIAMYRCIKCPLLHCDHCLVTADCAGPRARVSSRRRATPPRSALPATRTTAPPPVATTECRVSPIWTGVR